jgi:hypothetical protein
MRSIEKTNVINVDVLQEPLFGDRMTRVKMMAL